MELSILRYDTSVVALRKESVDRNRISRLPRYATVKVALRKESVDRNWCQLIVRSFINRVALRKESVDRNLVVGLLCTFTSLSLSARRAWIEIFRPSPQVKPVRVALRKESVDRNCDLEPIRNTEAVALRKESVDRNPV